MTALFDCKYRGAQLRTGHPSTCRYLRASLVVGMLRPGTTPVVSAHGGGGGVDVAQPISELPRLPLARGRPPFAFPGMLAHAASTTCAPPALPPTGPGLPPGTAPRDCPQGPLHHCPPGPPPPADWPRRPRFPDPPPP